MPLEKASEVWGLGKTTGIGKCNPLKSFRLGFMPLHGKEIASHLDVLEKLGRRGRAVTLHQVQRFWFQQGPISHHCIQQVVSE